MHTNQFRPKPADQRYATLEDLRQLNDMATVDCVAEYVTVSGQTIPFWVDANGNPLWLRIRGPDFTMRREIEQAAGDDDHEHIIESVWRFLVEPQIPRDAIALLAHRHPAAIDQIYETGWGLAALPASLITREVERLAGVENARGHNPQRGAVARGVAPKARKTAKR